MRPKCHNALLAQNEVMLIQRTTQQYATYFSVRKKKLDDFFLRKLGVWRQFCINLPEIYNNMKRLIENNNSLIVFHECIRSVCMNHHSRAATCSYLLSSSWARSLHFASIRQNLVFGFGYYIFFLHFRLQLDYVIEDKDRGSKHIRSPFGMMHMQCTDKYNLKQNKNAIFWYDSMQPRPTRLPSAAHLVRWTSFEPCFACQIKWIGQGKTTSLLKLIKTKKRICLSLLCSYWRHWFDIRQAARDRT